MTRPATPTPPPLPGLGLPDPAQTRLDDLAAARTQRRRRALMADIEQQVREHMADHQRHAHRAQLAKRDDPLQSARESYLAILCVLSAVEALTHPLLPDDQIDLPRIRSVLAMRTPT